MEKLISFVQEHLDDDTSRLILDRQKHPDVDVAFAVNCIESRRKLKGKVQEWYEEPRLVFPFRLSAEQCSSSDTGRYKATFARKIAETITSDRFRIADLTGGFGVDTWFFSKEAEKVLYCEMQQELCAAAEHNFHILGAGNITVRNLEITPESLTSAFSDFRPDIIFLDPARRGEGGKKVFLLEDCTPDILSLKEGLFDHSRHILLKLSPMADITMVCSRLGMHCREVVAVGAGGECKELLVWLDKEWNAGYSVTAAELSPADSGSALMEFTFTPEEEKSAIPEIATESELEAAAFIFEPGKALMKAGAFNLIGKRFGLKKLGRSTHYYVCITSDRIEEIRLGKLHKILRCAPLDKRSIKSFGAEYPKAEITARNIPMDTDTLRKKLSAASGNEIHIFGLKSDTAGNILIATTRHS